MMVSEPPQCGVDLAHSDWSWNVLSVILHEENAIFADTDAVQHLAHLWLVQGRDIHPPPLTCRAS
eukprot:1720880-Amphidinium_carterae.1